MKKPQVHSEIKHRVTLNLKAPVGEDLRSVQMQNLVAEFAFQVSMGTQNEWVAQAMLDRVAREMAAGIGCGAGVVQGQAGSPFSHLALVQPSGVAAVRAANHSEASAPLASSPSVQDGARSAQSSAAEDGAVVPAALQHSTAPPGKPVPRKLTNVM